MVCKFFFLDTRKGRKHFLGYGKREEGSSCSGHFSVPSSSLLDLLLSLLNLYLVASFENLDCSLRSFDTKGELLIQV